MDDLFLRILDMSITASWVILAVMAVRLLLRKAPKKYSYALWAAVLFRLVCPVSIQSVVSAFNFSPFRQAASQATGELQFIPRDIEFAATPQINTGIPVVDNVVNNQLPAVIPEVSVTPEVSITPMQMLIFIGMTAWIIGMAAMVAISIVNYIRLRKGLRFAVRMEDNIWLCETVRSPFLVGLVKPKIYLPYGLDEQTQEYILAHEKYHLKRLDHIAKLLGYAALTVHWFNPLCHVAFRMMNRDMEMSCDEHVLDRNNIPTTRYSLSLLTIATNRRFPAATPLAFAETGVRERMINVLNWKKPKKWVSVVAVLVCAILLISCATNPKVNDATTDPSTVDTTIAGDSAEDATAVGDPAMLEIPGMKWGATRKEVRDELDLPEENYLYDDPYADTAWIIVVEDFTLFGEEVAYGRFWFTKYPWIEDYALQNAELYYKDEADMAVVRDALTELYGAPNDGLGFARYRVRNGAVESYTEPGFTGYYVDVDEPVMGWWESPAKRADALPADIQETMISSGIVDNSGAGSGLDTTDPASRDIVLEYLERDPAVLLYCTNGKRSNNTILPQCTTQNAVIFNATEYMWALQYFQLNYVGYTYVDDASLLEFPRIKWGASVEEVKQALNITEEQISTDMFTEASNFDTHYLHVKDITFFGEEVSVGCFKFRSVDDENLGLSYIMLFLDEDTDMEHLQAELSYHYQNQGTGEYFDTCKWEIKDEVNFDPDADRRVEYELVEGKSRGGDAELWYLADNPPSGSGFKLYEAVQKVVEDPEFKTYNWVSPVKLTEVISSEGQNALKEVYEQNLGIDPSTTEEYLAKRPPVWMSISNRSLQATRAELEGVTEGELALATHNLVILDAQTLIEFQHEAQRLQKVLESE